MRRWRVYTVLLFSIFITNCSLQKEITNPQSSAITWENLQIEPKSDGDVCAEMSPDDIDDFEDIKRYFPSSGLTVGFLPKDLLAPHRISHETYWVNANEQLTFDWFFWYPDGNETPATLRLLVLLDERQLENALPESGPFNDINLDKGNDLLIKVKIPPLEPGVHDLIAIGIPFPENEPDVYGITVEIYRRITLIAEPASAPFRKTSFTPLPIEGSLKHNDPLMALELTLQNNGIHVWNWPDPWLHIHTGTSTRFFALSGHQDVTNLDAPSEEPLEESFFAILLFVDFQQIEATPNQMASYHKVGKDNAYGRIPLEIPPLTAGKHRILVLRIDTPGVPYCILRGDPNGRFLPFGIYGKLVGIDVLPSE